MKLTQEQINTRIENIMTNITEDENLCTIRDALTYYFETFDDEETTIICNCDICIKGRGLI